MAERKLLQIVDVIELLARIADSSDLLSETGEYEGLGARCHDVDELRRIVREYRTLVPPLVSALARLETCRRMAQQMRNNCNDDMKPFRDGQLRAFEEAIDVVQAAMDAESE